MADVVHRTTKEYKRSVNTPDFPGASYVINPDLSNVTGFPSRYWIITGDTVTLMSQAARDALDAAAVNAGKDSQAANLEDTLNALIQALNDGSFVPNSSYNSTQIETIIRNKL